MKARIMGLIFLLGYLLFGCAAHKPPKPEWKRWPSNGAIYLTCPDGWLLVNSDHCERDSKPPKIGAPPHCDHYSPPSGVAECRCEGPYEYNPQTQHCERKP